MDALITPAIEHPVQELDTRTDTRDYLAHARRDAEAKGFADCFHSDTIINNGFIGQTRKWDVFLTFHNKITMDFIGEDNDTFFEAEFTHLH